MTHGEWGFLFRTAMPRNRFPEQCALPGTIRIGSNRRLSLHGTSLAEGNANFSIVIVFRYADDLMAGFEHREEAERLQGINQGVLTLLKP